MMLSFLLANLLLYFVFPLLLICFTLKWYFKCKLWYYEQKKEIDKDN